MINPSFAHFRRCLYALVAASGLAVTAQAQVASPDLLRAQQAVQNAQAADADLARVRSDRAQADAALHQRREEIAGLRQALGLPAEVAP